MEPQLSQLGASDWKPANWVSRVPPPLPLVSGSMAPARSRLFESMTARPPVYRAEVTNSSFTSNAPLPLAWGRFEAESCAGFDLGLSESAEEADLAAGFEAALAEDFEADGPSPPGPLSPSGRGGDTSAAEAAGA